MEVNLNDERVNLLQEIGFPFSLIGRCQDTDGIGYVDISFEQTIQEAITYLSELGHTHIGFLNQSQALFDAGYGPAVRAQAHFEQVMSSAGLEGVTRLCHAVPQAGQDAFNEMLDECPGLTALIIMNERAIPGVMRAVADRDWRIPDDFSLVAVVSSARVAEMMLPPLTTADAPSAELGHLGTELLIQQLEAEEKDTQQVLLPCRLTVRGSSGPCRRNIDEPGQ